MSIVLKGRMDGFTKNISQFVGLQNNLKIVGSSFKLYWKDKNFNGCAQHCVHVHECMGRCFLQSAVCACTVDVPYVNSHKNKSRRGTPTQSTNRSFKKTVVLYIIPINRELILCSILKVENNLSIFQLRVCFK